MHAEAWHANTSSVQDWTDLAQRGMSGAAARAYAAQRAARQAADPDHYACLGLPHSAYAADVKAAFRCDRSPCCVYCRMAVRESVTHEVGVIDPSPCALHCHRYRTSRKGCSWWSCNHHA